MCVVTSFVGMRSPHINAIIVHSRSVCTSTYADIYEVMNERCSRRINTIIAYSSSVCSTCWLLQAQAISSFFEFHATVVVEVVAVGTHFLTVAAAAVWSVEIVVVGGIVVVVVVSVVAVVVVVVDVVDVVVVGVVVVVGGGGCAIVALLGISYG